MGISSAGLYPAQYADSQGLKTNVNLKTLLKTKDAHGYQPFGFIFMGSQLTSLNLDDLTVQERRLGQGQTVAPDEPEGAWQWIKTIKSLQDMGVLSLAYKGASGLAAS